jgi:hypothetical protein
MIPIICILLLIIFILDYKTKQLKQNKKEQFKNEQIYEQKYLNDPIKLASYKAKISKYKPKYKLKIDRSNEKSVDDSIFDQRDDKITERDQKNKVLENSIHKQKYNQIKIKSKPEQKIKFDPIIRNIEPKYKLYADNNMNFREGGKIYLNSKQNIDQNTNTNIMDFINNNKITQIDTTEKIPDFNLYNSIISQIGQTPKPNNSIQNKGKTIKDIYDELTNDNRLELQQNMDDLCAYDNRYDFIIGEKYGATRFDTYSVD